MTSIGYQAFQNTNSDSDIYFLGNAPSIEFPGFSGGDAFVTNCATGFPESGGWNQLSINVVESATPCSVVYNLNGGVGITSAALGSNGSVALPSSPTRAGYTFAGWSATNGGALISAFPYVSGSSGSNVNLFASWTPNTNTVFYNTGGGSLVPNGSFLTGGQVGTAPVNPTRDGYEFVSWIDPDETWRNLRFPFSPGVTSDVTIYARWQRILGAVSPNVEESLPTQNQSGSQNNSQPSPPGIVPQPTPPQVVPPVALVPVASYSMVFSSGSKALAISAQTEIKKLVTKSGSEAKYTIIAAASMVRGLPKSFVSNLAKSRAAKIRAHLIKLGVRSEDISIKLVINKQGLAPASKITVKK